MDLAGMSQAVAAAVGAYLANAGATYVADSVAHQVHTWLSEKLGGSRIGRHLLDVLAQNPADASARTAVEQAILDRAEQDQQFESELRTWAARLQQVTTQGSIGDRAVAHGGVNIAGSPHGKISLRGVIAGRDHIDLSRRTLRVGIGGLVGIVAAVVVLIVAVLLLLPDPDEPARQPKALPSKAVEALDGVRFCGGFESQGCKVIDAVPAPAQAKGVAGDAQYDDVWCVVYRYEFRSQTGTSGAVLGRQAKLWSVVDEGQDAFLKRGCSNYPAG
ncbi:MAG: hypothetical protein ACRDT8_16670 [Micromonosporaceae bacterium]